MSLLLLFTLLFAKKCGTRCHDPTFLNGEFLVSFFILLIHPHQEASHLLPQDFSHSLFGKESACNAGDLSLIPGPGRSSGEGNGNPLQYSCLENTMDRGAWQAKVHGITRVCHDLMIKPPPLSAVRVASSA